MKIYHRAQLVDILKSQKLPLSAVELGVAEGRFSRELLDKGLELLYLVDIWECVPFIDGCASFDDAWHNENYSKVMAEFDGLEKVIILKGFSYKMAEFVNNGVGLVYIDGDHSYQGVKADIKVWWDKITPGGIMAFHDYANPDYGVKRAVIEFIGNENLVNVIEENGSIENIGAWIQKPKQ